MAGERRVILEVRGIVNHFGTQVVHDGLDMQVYERDVFGIVGGSGAGKSVLLRTILGLQHPSAGVVSIDGRDLRQLSNMELRSVQAEYGVTFQAGALYSSLTVLQNVQFPMLEHLQLPAAAANSAHRLELPVPRARPDKQLLSAACRRHGSAVTRLLSARSRCRWGHATRQSRPEAASG